MGRTSKNKGMVRMSKDGVTHEFALESVPVWEAKDWKVDDSEQQSEANEVVKVLTEAATEEEQENPDAAVFKAISNEPKAVTGPSVKSKK